MRDMYHAVDGHVVRLSGRVEVRWERANDLGPSRFEEINDIHLSAQKRGLCGAIAALRALRDLSVIKVYTLAFVGIEDGTRRTEENAELTPRQSSSGAGHREPTLVSGRETDRKTPGRRVMIVRIHHACIAPTCQGGGQVW